MVTLSYLLKRKSMSDNFLGIDYAILHVFNHPGKKSFHRTLIGSNCNAFIYNISNGYQGICRSINSDYGNNSSFFY